MCNEENILKAVEAYKNGHSLEMACQEFGVGQRSLSNRCKKAGVLRAYTKRKKTIPKLEGRVFGKLTAIESFVEIEGRVLWFCQCSCGTKQKVRQTHLLKGKVNQCGNCAITGENSSLWKGCGQLCGTYWRFIKDGAVRQSRTLEFSISIEYAWEAYQKQNGKCALTGMEIPMPEKVDDGFVASLDRIDPTKGYIVGNVQWVHKEINIMKWDHFQDHFIRLCELVADYSAREHVQQ